MDALTGILTSLRLTGGIAAEAQAAGDWCLRSKFAEIDDTVVLPPDSALIGYHYVRSGRFFARVEGEPEIEVTAGSIILVPRNDPHFMYTRAGLPPVDSHSLVERDEQGTDRIQIAGDGEPACFYCGFLSIASEHRFVLDSLPSLIKLEREDALRSDWMESSMQILSQSQDSPEIVIRLAELFFVEAIHRYVDNQPKSEAGWIAGLDDPAVAKALAMIHNRYAENLDVDALAREAGVSRSVLRDRFVELLGEPPMRHCARWRMRMAANMLRDGRENASTVAYAVGFNSEAAFSRAFKREFGIPPGSWRRQLDGSNEPEVVAAD